MIPPAGRDVRCDSCGTVWFERPTPETAVVETVELAPGEVALIPGTRAIAKALPQLPSWAGFRSGRADERAPVPLMVARLRDAVDLKRAAAFAKALPLDAMARGLADTWTDFLTIERRREAPQAPLLLISPGDAAAQKVRARVRGRALNRLTPRRSVAWAAWVLAVFALLQHTVIDPARLHDLWPRTERVYAWFGAPEAAAIQVTDVSSRYAVSLHGPVLEVRGTVRNDGAAPVVPHLRLTAADLPGADAATAAVPEVPPGGTRPFVLRAQLPAGVPTETLVLHADAQPIAAPLAAPARLAGGLPPGRAIRSSAGIDLLAAARKD